MGRLVDQIQGLGYHISEGRALRSVPVGDILVEIRELQARSGDGQVMTI